MWQYTQNVSKLPLYSFSGKQRGRLLSCSEGEYLTWDNSCLEIDDLCTDLFFSILTELKHQTFLTTRTAGRSRRTGSRPAFLARNRKVNTFARKSSNIDIFLKLSPL